MFLRRIGYWSGGHSRETYLPNPHDFVDPDWDADERGDVLHHLRSHPATWWHMGYSPCRMCDKKDNRSGELTDGDLRLAGGARALCPGPRRAVAGVVRYPRARQHRRARTSRRGRRLVAGGGTPTRAGGDGTIPFRLARIDCGAEGSTHLVYAADDGQRVLVAWETERAAGDDVGLIGNPAPNALGFGAGLPTGPNDRLVADAGQSRGHMKAAVSVAQAEPVQALSPVVIHTDRVAAVALQRAAEQLHLSLGQPPSRHDRSTLQLDLAAIEARGPFDPVRQRELVQLLLAVGEHVGGDADGLWARLVTPESLDSQEQPGELGSGDPHDA